MIKAFPKIFAIGTDYIRDIFADEVEITEKIDGSQFDFGKIDGQLYMRSKGMQLFAENPEKMFQNGIDYVVSIEEKIPDNTIFFCEYLKTPKHNILKYDRIPANHLILFCVSDNTEKFQLSNLNEYAQLLGIEAVPVIYKGFIKSSDEIINLIKQKSILGGVDMEGVVIKNYNKPFLLGGQPIPLMSGKYVSEAFKETHREKWGSEFSSAGKWATFISSFNTQARWHKAVQHLTEKGELENSPRDIGKLLKEVQSDIESEEAENIKSFLWNEYKREVLGGAVKGFPEWYKQELLKRAFTDEPDINEMNDDFARAIDRKD